MAPSTVCRYEIHRNCLLPMQIRFMSNCPYIMIWPYKLRLIRRWNIAIEFFKRRYLPNERGDISLFLHQLLSPICQEYDSGISRWPMSSKPFFFQILAPMRFSRCIGRIHEPNYKISLNRHQSTALIFRSFFMNYHSIILNEHIRCVLSFCSTECWHAL